ncbi:hypothetical protein KUCAC02_004206 [Chaenocephalus aceratus]|uniref:Uncharacterized protein n=1 Tax=Chaenocephalus aceratus TaxID=36190 RepID=A0ACB9WXW9_CHAAC|nr:hypothetical protein KUCAC02_004206 [Chaenocephalus aceratus]
MHLLKSTFIIIIITMVIVTCGIYLHYIILRCFHMCVLLIHMYT